MDKEMSRTRPAALVAAFALLLAACGGSKDSSAGTRAEGSAAPGTSTPAAGAADSAAPAQQQASAPQGPVGPTTQVPANELGRIMVLEYHRIARPGDKEGEFVRTAANFRKDLQELYQRGYRPVTMKQVATGDINLPAGTTPVVFTIDDSSRGQFYYLPDGRIDPNTMVGMWEEFARTHPGWTGGATWCVLPAAGPPSNFFSEKPDREIPRAEREANIRKKVSHLVENGHEICNHTFFHARLDKAKSDAQAEEWIGRGNDSIQAYLPAGYKITTFALPLGMWPRNRALAWQGSWNGKPYAYNAVLEVSGGPNVSPYDRRWNGRSVNRFIVAPGALERQLKHWDTNPAERYVSDGDPRTVSYPQRSAANLDRSKLGGRTPRQVQDAAAPVAAAPAGQGASR